ncbi:MAG TPA: DUF6069 family protein [Nocardioides sp.]|jgi:hypothetical protein|nr:DUF6069 family protein [Nocardioides sp.]
MMIEVKDRNAATQTRTRANRNEGPRGLVVTGVIATLLAMAAAAATGAIAKALGVDFELPDGGEAVPTFGFAVMTGICAAVGVLIAAGLRQWSPSPARTFLRTALTLTAISLVPPFLAEADAATVTGLVVIHLVAASVMIPALTRCLPDRVSR